MTGVDEMGRMGKLCVMGAMGLIAFGAQGGELSPSQYSLVDSVMTVKASVRELSAYALADRDDVAEVRFEKGSGISKIGEYAFLGCGNLRKIELPASVSTLGEGCFRECVSLREIHLPDRITVLPRYVFAWCENLRDVALPSGLKDISAHSFAYCSSLKRMDFPKSLTHIGSNAFSRNIHLEEVMLPSGIRELESYAFSDCMALKTITFPANDCLLGELILSGCDSLETLYELSPVPPKFDCESFIFEPDEAAKYESVRLVVLWGKEEAYRNAHGWSLFRIIESSEKMRSNY